VQRGFQYREPQPEAPGDSGGMVRHNGREPCRMGTICFQW